jgi:hypothetical protein
LNVGGRVRAVRVVGASNRRFPGAVYLTFERRINRVEGVLEEWVRHGGRFSIGCDDIDGFQGDNFRRRDDVSRPVPVWRSQVLGCGDPALFINLVRVGDLDSVLLKHLLDNWVDIITVYAKHEIVNLPHKEPRRACAKLGRVRSRECSIRPTETL